jgi:CubicO group peptidase (beta-lactamase class C family)
MTTRTSFHFASVTKMATAALTLRLAEQGRLGRDDPIIRWYPAWRGDRSATVRDPLGPTAGTKDPTDASSGSTRPTRSPLTVREYIRAGRQSRLRAPTASSRGSARTGRAAASRCGHADMTATPRARG